MEKVKPSFEIELPRSRTGCCALIGGARPLAKLIAGQVLPERVHHGLSNLVLNVKEVVRSDFSFVSLRPQR